jgi:tRNA-specific 2-thiouridylase
LKRARFPVGHLSKDAVRDVARRLALPVAEKPDSQEICFVPDGDYAAFIERKTGSQDTSGPIVNQAGDVLGRHAGVHRFTVGQRKGLRLSVGEPMYVLELRRADQAIVVGARPELERTTLTASRVNWISGSAPRGPVRATAQIRHRHQPAAATVCAIDDRRASVAFDTPVVAITPGQAVVFYDADRVLGGGWID